MTRFYDTVESEGRQMKQCLKKKDLQSPFTLWDHRLNMEFDLNSLFGLLCTAVLDVWDPTTPPRILGHIRGRYWSAEIDNIFL